MTRLLYSPCGSCLARIRSQSFRRFAFKKLITFSALSFCVWLHLLQALVSRSGKVSISKKKILVSCEIRFHAVTKSRGSRGVPRHLCPANDLVVTSHYIYIYICIYPTSKKYMLSKKWSHRNSKVSSHQANQMFVYARTRIHMRVHTLHTFSVFSKLEVSKWSRFSSQSNGTHTHLSSHIHTSYVKEYRGT